MVCASNYIGMHLKGYDVIGYYIKESNNYIELSLRCCNCTSVKRIKIGYEKVTKIRCNTCKRLAIVVPMTYYRGTKIANEIVVIGEYKYRRLKKLYKQIKDNTKLTELQFIRNNLR